MRYTIKQLLRVRDYFRANPDATLPMPVWTNDVMNREQWHRWFRKCLDEKINSKDPRFPNGRKATVEHEIALLRMKGYIGSRVIIRWIDPILGPRVKEAFAHRNGE